MRFLAEHVVLERILDLKPRTQHFDGLEEELVRQFCSTLRWISTIVPTILLLFHILQGWTPWTLCEAYAEKRGYRTDRRGRPDHQRAGSELVRDTVDGILPLFFLPPDYAGKDITPASIAKYCEQEEASLKNEESDVDADSEEGDSSEEMEEEDSSVPQSARRKNQHSAPVNAFSLLDSDSSDEDSDEN